MSTVAWLLAIILVACVIALAVVVLRRDKTPSTAEQDESLQ